MEDNVLTANRETEHKFNFHDYDETWYLGDKEADRPFTSKAGYENKANMMMASPGYYTVDKTRPFFRKDDYGQEYFIVIEPNENGAPATRFLPKSQFASYFREIERKKKTQAKEEKRYQKFLFYRKHWILGFFRSCLTPPRWHRAEEWGYEETIKSRIIAIIVQAVLLSICAALSPVLLPFAFLGLYIGILIACQILIIASWTILKPFIFIRRMLTNTLDNSGNVEFKGGRMKVHYKNTFQLVFFGVFGNLFYFVAMFLLLSTLISFRPYKTGYIIKSPAFTTGDQVVVKIDDKRYLTVYEDTVDGLNHYDPDVVVLTDSGRETVSYFDICGKYDTSLEGNTEPLKVSILGFVKWLPGRIVREIGSGWWKFKALMVGTENM